MTLAKDKGINYVDLTKTRGLHCMMWGVMAELRVEARRADFHFSESCWLQCWAESGGLGWRTFLIQLRENGGLVRGGCGTTGEMALGPRYGHLRSDRSNSLLDHPWGVKGTHASQECFQNVGLGH